VLGVGVDGWLESRVRMLVLWRDEDMSSPLPVYIATLLGPGNKASNADLLQDRHHVSAGYCEALLESSSGTAFSLPGHHVVLKERRVAHVRIASWTAQCSLAIVICHCMSLNFSMAGTT
jgi:hypothetical protein